MDRITVNVPEDDSPNFGEHDMNENEETSLDDAVDELYEENERKFDKDDLDGGHD